MTTTAEHLAAITNDLTDLIDLARWAHADGWTPGAPDPHRATRQPRRPINQAYPNDRPPPEHPDEIRAPRHDIGMGSHRRRQAIRHAATQIVAADVHLAIAAHQTGATAQPTTRRLRDTAGPLERIETTVARSRHRIALIDPDARGHAKAHVRDARRLIDQAHRRLTSSFAQGPAGTDTTTEPLCRICNIRPPADRAGGRCSTCYAWKARNGHERPTSLDSDDITQAHQAQRRRQRRGESWGDESLSGTRTPGEP